LLVALLLLLLVAAACRPSQEPSGAAPGSGTGDAAPHAPSLESAVATLLAAPELPAAVAELQLDPAAFAAVLVPPFEHLHTSYAAAFTAAAPAFTAELRRLAAANGAGSAAPSITVRRHYAGDAAISLAQGRVRWAQPVQSESWLVSLGDTLVDTVWVSHRGRWFVLLGLDEAMRAALASRTSGAPDCAAAALLAGRPGACSDAIWMALDGALRGQDDRIARACDRAIHLCH
jgi:hypothetical protein